MSGVDSTRGAMAAADGGRREMLLWGLQRLTAVLMAPLILVHLATIVAAVQGGLSAEEILGRTRGSGLAAAFYGAFVVLAGLHAAVGVRGLLREKSGLRGGLLELLSAAFAAGLVVVGLRAVMGLVA